MLSDDFNKKIIDFDTIYIINMNGNKYNDAIVSYWHHKVFTSGHCVLPHRAIIMGSDKGYVVLYEEFIPPTYEVDSIIQTENGTHIIGKVFECTNNIFRKRLNINIISK